MMLVFLLSVFFIALMIAFVRMILSPVKNVGGDWTIWLVLAPAILAFLGVVGFIIWAMLFMAFEMGGVSGAFLLVGGIGGLLFRFGLFKAIIDGNGK